MSYGNERTIHQKRHTTLNCAQCRAYSVITSRGPRLRSDIILYFSSLWNINTGHSGSLGWTCSVLISSFSSLDSFSAASVATTCLPCRSVNSLTLSSRLFFTSWTLASCSCSAAWAFAVASSYSSTINNRGGSGILANSRTETIRDHARPSPFPFLSDMSGLNLKLTCLCLPHRGSGASRVGTTLDPPLNKTEFSIYTTGSQYTPLHYHCCAAITINANVASNKSNQRFGILLPPYKWYGTSLVALKF